MANAGLLKFTWSWSVGKNVAMPAFKAPEGAILGDGDNWSVNVFK